MNVDRRPTAVVAEDEPHLAQFLVGRLAVHWPELDVVGWRATVSRPVDLVRAHQPDVAFLDIRMPGMTGLEVAQDLAGVDIVFVTAFDQYAVSAFERAAVDYLLKPVSDERLSATVQRLSARLAERQRAERPEPAPEVLQALALLRDHLPQLGTAARAADRLAWIRAAVGQQVRLIPVEEVAYFEANDKYTSVFTAQGEALIRTPLKELLAQLDPDRFWQIHRGTIVNLAHVTSTSRDIAGRVKVNLRAPQIALPVSRAFVHRFRQM